jgi:hypothetical protein
MEGPVKNRLENIFEGWTKSLGLRKVKKENRELAAARVKICISCPHAKEMWLKKFIDGMLQRDIEGSGIGCELCGCPVNEKALVNNETCPDNRW